MEMTQQTKPIAYHYLLWVKSWFYPNTVWNLLNFSVYNSFCRLKFWICLENTVNNIL